MLGAWPLLAPVWRMSARELGEAFALVAGVHLAVNLVGYARRGPHRSALRSPQIAGPRERGGGSLWVSCLSS